MSIRKVLIVAAALAAAVFITAATYLTIGTSEPRVVSAQATGLMPQMESLGQALRMLNETENPPELRIQAANQLVPLLTGNPLVLPTMNSEDTQLLIESTEFFNRLAEDLQQVIGATSAIKETLSEIPEVRMAAAQASMMAEQINSVVLGLAARTQGVDTFLPMPQDLRGVVRGKELDSGFIHPPSPGRPVETVITGQVGFDSAHVVTKEIFGIKAVLYLRVIPIYQEPWDIRMSPIIGFKRVFFIRFVPAEHIKSLIYWQDTDGRIKLDVQQHDILMPGVNKFWGFYNPPMPAVAAGP